jgi:type I restriction-modification system DNA methylase subunit
MTPSSPCLGMYNRGMDAAAGYLRKGKLSTSQLNTLQTKMFYGKEKKSLAYVIAIMNMILHGIEAPNIVHTNTLSENLADIQEKDRYDVVLANPPFGGKERPEVQQNFPIRTGETAFLFLQHFIKMLKAGGRGGIVIKNTFLSNTDNASVSLRKLLLESCNLHTVLDLPGGTFQGAGVKTVVLFFEKGAPTRKVWFYQLDPGRNMGKTNPLNDDDLAEFVELQKKRANSPKSWSVETKSVNQMTLDLSVKNPNGGEEVIAFALAPITREERVESRKERIFSAYDDEKLRTFLDFVLGEYVKEGVAELDQAKLPQLLALKYRAVNDAARELGGIPKIRDTFIGFQKFLYERVG